jgi:L-threonylcarbamoyladenylate synthase
LTESGESQFTKAIRILRDGGLIIAPTETFYGILADVWSQKAVTRLVQLKSRKYGKPIPLIAGSKEMAQTVVSQIPALFEPLAEKFWPGPLTLVLKAGKNLPHGITAGTDSIGVRVPSQSPALDLTRFYRRPLTATSANFEGKSAPRSVKELDPVLAEEVDMVIDGGWTKGNLPSTVLNIITTPPYIIRKGIIGDQVQDFLSMKPWEKEGGQK